MKKLTAALNITLSWLAAWWSHGRAPEVVRQYRLMKAQCPLALADLARFCSAFDSTFDPDNARLSDRNAGKREVWLFIEAMMELTPEDLMILRNQTETNDDGG